MMMFNRTEKDDDDDDDKEYTKQAVHNTISHDPPTDAQSFPEQWRSPDNSPSLYVHHGVIWYGISLWSVWVRCPGHVPAQLLASRAREAEKSFTSVSITYQHLKHQCVTDTILILTPKHSTILPTRKKNNSIPAENNIE